MRRRPRRPGKINFAGFTIVNLPDACTRTVTKFYRNGVCTAVLQKNGRIAISRSGIFDHPTSERARLRVAQCLHGLKLVGDAVLADYEKQYGDQETNRALTELEFEAEVLGYRVVKKPEAKKPRVRKSRAK